MMVSQRKFLEIDRHPVVSYRSTVKDSSDQSLNSRLADFCVDRTEEKNIENCSLRSAEEAQKKEFYGILIVLIFSTILSFVQVSLPIFGQIDRGISA
jgi:hypothetical protein